MLTPREKEVLELVCKGYSNSQIANELIISTHTAKAHVTSIIRKLGLENRTLVACYAVQKHLVDIDFESMKYLKDY
ncbi:response regulator transcription factor [bacterium]|nr:response regulator transcription factor [bacterium]MBO5446301.1 response regulator transcription factor [bacterium]